MSEPTSGQGGHPERDESRWGAGVGPPHAPGEPAVQEEVVTGWSDHGAGGQDGPTPPDGPTGSGHVHSPPPKRWRRWPWIVLAGLVFLGAVAGIATAVHGESTKQVTVRYSITGTARDVAVAYSTWHGGNISTTKETVKALPWHLKVTTKEYRTGGSLAVTLGASGGTVTCAAVKDDGKVHTDTASGPSATAYCSGF
ncbi:hypothetical protein V2S66_07915 [Streptomyces sp. V4-01]|uniref:MmpS family membrane protein n=1 Tax=Actinacidiphila polyblastidii TaxID=3110430 RepID=A0ABU7P7U5_9ACTN|nr:hypothetical protein [Streptomyces sp. V4-01]